MSSRCKLSVINDAAGASDWRFAIRALRHRNYLLFFSGQTVSLIGTWMTRIATSWRACCIAGAGWFLSKLPQIRAHIRPIYGRLGILPEIAQGLQAAAVLQIPPED